MFLKFQERQSPGPAHRGRSAGLTLLEVLFVMAVLAIMIALVIGLGRYSDSAARINQARADLGEWSVALDRWRDIFGEFPRPPQDTNVVWLASNTVEVARFMPADHEASIKYLSGDGSRNILEMAAFFRDLPLVDPWRKPYHYEAGPNSGDANAPMIDYLLYSAGPDGKDDTTHDNIQFAN